MTYVDVHILRPKMRRKVLMAKSPNIDNFRFPGPVPLLNVEKSRPLLDDSRDGGPQSLTLLNRPTGETEIHKGVTVFDRYLETAFRTVLEKTILATESGYRLPSQEDVANWSAGYAVDLMKRRSEFLHAEVKEESPAK